MTEDSNQQPNTNLQTKTTKQTNSLLNGGQTPSTSQKQSKWPMNINRHKYWDRKNRAVALIQFQIKTNNKGILCIKEQ